MFVGLDVGLFGQALVSMGLSSRNVPLIHVMTNGTFYLASPFTACCASQYLCGTGPGGTKACSK